MKQRSGSSWAAMVVFFGLFGCQGFVGCEYDRNDVRNEAKKWLDEMGYRYAGYSCSEVDSDGDGYVSCSVNVTGETEPLAIECRAWSGHGCKKTIPKIVNIVRR